MTPTLRAVNNHLLSYVGLNLTPIPLKPRSKKPLVKWGKEWNPTLEELEVWASRPNINWGVRCGAGLAVLDFDSLGHIVTIHPYCRLASDWKQVRLPYGRTVLVTK